MDMTSLVMQLVVGALGGNVGGFLAKARSLGPLLNTILGAVGGVGGGSLLGGVLTNVLGGNATAGTATASGLLGMLLPIIGGMLKKK